MKILHVGPIKPTRAAGGPSHSIRGLASAQAELGLNVGLLSSLPLPPNVSMEGTPGVYPLINPRERHYNPWWISPDWISRIQTEFGTPNLVNFHTFYTPFQCALARGCRQVGWPYIITPRGELTYLAQSIKRTKKCIANFLCFRSYVRRAAAIHALCPQEAGQIQALFTVQKIVTVPNGVDNYLLEAAEKLSAADLGDFSRDGDLILGFVGRIDVYIKGLDLLLKALNRIKLLTAPLVCKLLIVGPFFTNRDKKYVLSTITKLRLQDTVKLVGPKYGRDKLRHFLACDVCVQTSRSEGMPMAVLEAMALGRPCLVTPGTGMSDVVRRGGGWECEPNPESIAETIKSIYAKRDSFKTLGQQSRELIRRKFTWRSVAEQLKQEYAKICNASI